MRRIKNKDKEILIEKLNNAFLEMDVNYHINFGGCCYVAYKLAESLEKYNIKYSVIWDTNIDYKVRTIDLKLNRIYGCHHVCLYVPSIQKYINVIGNDEDTCEEYDWHRKHHINSKNLKTLYYKQSWNPYYNKMCNGAVALRINNIFKKILNNYETEEN